MRKYLFALLVLVAAGSTLFVATLATADSGANKISAKDGLEGYQEAPSLSTIAGGSFEADVANDGLSFDWTLSYRDLEGPVTQAHIHIAQRGVSGGISIWLCKTAATAANAPAGTLDCPASPATISGTADASDMVALNGQGIALGEFNEALAAIRAGKAYANVHSTKFGPGEIRGQLNDANER